MKYITSIIKLLSLALLLIVGYACTDNSIKSTGRIIRLTKKSWGVKVIT